MQRKTLSQLVGTMFALLFAAFLFVLLNSLFGGDQGNVTNKAFSNLEPGQTKLIRFNGQRVWATRLTDRDRFLKIAAHVETSFESKESSCDVNKQFCVVSAATGKRGIELVFSKERPFQLDNDVPWMGGYVNPVTGQSYDLLGRPYRLKSTFRNKQRNNVDQYQLLRVIPAQ